MVRTGLEYVPARRRLDLVERLLDDVVAAGGRLVVGVFSEEREVRATEQLLESGGFTIAGRSERTHRDPRLVYRIVWIDRR